MPTQVPRPRNRTIDITPVTTVDLELTSSTTTIQHSIEITGLQRLLTTEAAR